MDANTLNANTLIADPAAADATLSAAGSRRSRNMRRLLWVAAIAVLVGAGVWRLRRNTSTPAVPQMKYETVKTDAGLIVAKVTASGTLSALVTVQVGAQVSGRVQEIFVDYNSPVKAGQIIAKLDALLFQAAVDQSHANLLTAQSALKTATAQATNAQRTFDRSKSLLDRSLIAQADFDTALANNDVAKAQADAAASGLEVARAAEHQAEVNLGYATITSPIDGTVISRNIDVGQTVASAFQAPVLFLIAKDLRKMQVDTSVSEADVGRLKTGMPTTFTVDAYPDEPFTGTGRQIRSSPTTVQNVVTYDAVIDVDNVELKLKPGMTANVAFVVARNERAVRVPNAALRFQPDVALLQEIGVPIPAATSGPGVKWLWRLRDNRPVPEQVTVGISDGTLTEIVGGNVHAGDALITDMTAVPRKRFGLF
jgi:HlyD family secretion protein